MGRLLKRVTKNGIHCGTCGFKLYTPPLGAISICPPCFAVPYPLYGKFPDRLFCSTECKHAYMDELWVGS